jgi:hypothetical protein
MQAQGYRGKLSIGFETTYNQAPTKGIQMPITSSKIKGSQNLITDNTIRGRRDPAQPSLGNIDVSGSVVIPVDDVNFGYWLRALLDSPVTTGSGDPYTHVFKTGLTQPSVSFEQQFPDINQYFLYTGCKVNKLALSFGGDQALTATIDVMGAKEVISGAPFDATLDNYPMRKFSNFMASIKEGGASIATVTKLDLSISTGLNGDTYTIGSQGFRNSVNSGIMQVSGTVTAFFDSATLLNKAIAGTTSSIDILLVDPVFPTHSLEIKLQELIYKRASPGIEGPTGVSIALPFEAFYNAGAENSCVVFTLINNHASYIV